VASEDLRDTLSVYYLTSTRLRSIGINIPIRQRTNIMSRVSMLRVRTFSRAGKAINFVFIQVKAPPSPDYVPGPEHADDEIAHPEDDDDEDPEEDPVDYPADRGDDGDDEEESSEDEEDDEMDVEADEEEEEHPAPVDS
nr:hypothetical protein [Tanacetum cinerariifolium]